MRRSSIAAALSSLALIGCGGDVVTLGHVSGQTGAGTSLPHFGEPRLIAELANDAESDNPTLTADLLEIYFASSRDGGAGDVDVWTAHRDSPDASFSAPEPVTAVNSEEFETSPAISPNGLELWVGVERAGGLGAQDIWVSRRATRSDDWSELENVRELNSPDKDIPRPPAHNATLMPLASRRGGADYYETYLAERPSLADPFGPPQELSELALDEFNTVDAFLTEDGLLLFFNRSPGAGEDTGDLFVARRESRTAAFGPAEALTDINTEHDERDPWLSPDGRHLFFSSDRDGVLSIYEALAVSH